MLDGKAVALRSDMRTEPKAWGPAADAPTFLPAGALAVEGLSVSAAPATAPRAAKQASRSSSSNSRSKSQSIITSAPKAQKAAPAAQAPAPRHTPAQPVIAPVAAVVSRNPSQSTVKPLPEAPAAVVPPAARAS